MRPTSPTGTTSGSGRWPRCPRGRRSPPRWRWSHRMSLRSMAATRSNCAIPTSSQFESTDDDEKKGEGLEVLHVSTPAAPGSPGLLFTLCIGFVETLACAWAGLSRLFNVLSSTNHVHHQGGRDPRGCQRRGASRLGAPLRHRPARANAVRLSPVRRRDDRSPPGDAPLIDSGWSASQAAHEIETNGVPASPAPTVRPQTGDDRRGRALPGHSWTRRPPWTRPRRGRPRRPLRSRLVRASHRRAGHARAARTRRGLGGGQRLRRGGACRQPRDAAPVVGRVRGGRAGSMSNIPSWSASHRGAGTSSVRSRSRRPPGGAGSASSTSEPMSPRRAGSMRPR